MRHEGDIHGWRFLILGRHHQQFTQTWNTECHVHVTTTSKMECVQCHLSGRLSNRLKCVNIIFRPISIEKGNYLSGKNSNWLPWCCLRQHALLRNELFELLALRRSQIPIENVLLNH